MYKEVIAKAKEHGYNGDIFVNTEDEYNEEDVFLTMCLIQRWLRNEKRLHINLDINSDSDTEYAYRIYNTHYPHMSRGGDGGWPYEECLIRAVHNAVNLLK